ncbi:MAG: hypothetical protein OXF23_05705 [Candidatus Dadabacteria bacterium]|nr:hypothetical protein [Candidatus Dadabacteria bacterium]MCY4262589.1 hypothetical protein [Candidatus Dadabacteria bacterium]
MPEEKISFVDALGQAQTGTRVAIEESIERFSIVKLADGSVLEVKMGVVEAIRLDNLWDERGNPVYSIRKNDIVTTISALDSRKKGE